MRYFAYNKFRQQNNWEDNFPRKASTLAILSHAFFLAFTHCPLFLVHRLGVASRQRCEETLIKTGWSLQLAASVLLESQV